MTAWLKRSFLTSALTCAACGAADQGHSVDAFALPLPEGFPAPAVPEDNPLTPEKVELGRFLFYDPRLSTNQTQSCASCHRQEKAFSDGRQVAVGSTGEVHPRNSPSLTNVAYNATLTWANPLLTTIEAQVLIPLFGDAPVELGARSEDRIVLDRFAADVAMRERFVAAYPNKDDPVQWESVVQALASFVRTLISGSSAFDRFVYAGERDALSTAARQGMELFFSERLECHHCHGGFNFSEASVHQDAAFDASRFHNTGLYNLDGMGAYPAHNTGVFEVTGRAEDMGRFRAPTLRNVAESAPYMHDGSMATLEEVVRFYEAGGRQIADGPLAGDGRQSPLKSGFVAGFVLSDDERRQLIAFLESLSDHVFLSDPRLADPFAS